MNKLEIELKQLIISRYMSVNRFCTVIGMPWGTLNSILERGVLNANINNVMKITHALHIDTDALADGQIKHTSSSLSSLSKEEQALVSAFRRLNSDQKDLICRMFGIKRHDTAVLRNEVI